MEALILFGKLIGMSLLVTTICLGGFYCGWKLVTIIIGDNNG